MRVGGRDKCPQKQFLKIKEHKILSAEKKEEIQLCIQAGKDRG